MDIYEGSQRAININPLSPPAHFGPFVRLLFWISKTSFKRKQRGSPTISRKVQGSGLLDFELWDAEEKKLPG
jgi:hypothetical protein